MRLHEWIVRAGTLGRMGVAQVPDPAAMCEFIYQHWKHFVPQKQTAKNNKVTVKLLTFALNQTFSLPVPRAHVFLLFLRTQRLSSGPTLYFVP